MTKVQNQSEKESSFDAISKNRWEHLIEIAFQLAESIDELDMGEAGAADQADEPQASRKRVAGALEALDALLEAFPGSIDPVEDVEGYGVRRMAVSLRRALSGLCIEATEAPGRKEGPSSD